jgi:hypothetical protein
MRGHIKPDDPAPEQGHYFEHNVFGSSSYPRRVVWCEAGELLGLKIPASNGALTIKIDFAVQPFRLKRQLVPANLTRSDRFPARIFLIMLAR